MKLLDHLDLINIRIEDSIYFEYKDLSLSLPLSQDIDHDLLLLIKDNLNKSIEKSIFNKNPGFFKMFGSSKKMIDYIGAYNSHLLIDYCIELSERLKKDLNDKK